MGSSRRPVMEMKNLLLFLAVVVGCHAATQEQLGGDKEMVVDKDKEMVRLIKFVRDHLALDVQANRNLTEESNNQTVDIAEAIIQHVNDVNDAATTRFEETLNKVTTAMEKNLRSVVDQTQKNHKKLEEQSKDNEEMIRREASEKLNDLLDKTKGRLAQHEQMLDTNVAVCAYKHNNDVAGKVQYDLKQMEIVSLPGGEMTQTSVLDLVEGEFTVPAAGSYQIAFTAIIDTIDNADGNLNPASFVFAKTQAAGDSVFRRMNSTTLTATVGQPGGDKVPVSRSIILDLQAGQKVAVFQTRKGAEYSYRVSFCAHLIRPRTPGSWEDLPESLEITEIKNESTYVEPELNFDDLTVGNLTVSLQAPEVEMPDTVPALLFPKTPFFKRIPVSHGVHTNKDPDNLG